MFRQSRGFAPLLVILAVYVVVEGGAAAITAYKKGAAGNANSIPAYSDSRKTSGEITPETYTSPLAPPETPMNNSSQKPSPQASKSEAVEETAAPIPGDERSTSTQNSKIPVSSSDTQTKTSDIAPTTRAGEETPDGGTGTLY